MNDSTVFVGLDVHKDSYVAAHAIGPGEVQNLRDIGVRECDLDRLCKRMQSKGSHARFVGEAGPTGYVLYRHLMQRGLECMVCAPSLIARKPAARAKTDQRNAVTLVKALRMTTCPGCPAAPHAGRVSRAASQRRWKSIRPASCENSYADTTHSGTNPNACVKSASILPACAHLHAASKHLPHQARESRKIQINNRFALDSESHVTARAQPAADRVARERPVDRDASPLLAGHGTQDDLFGADALIA